MDGTRLMTGDKRKNVEEALSQAHRTFITPLVSAYELNDADYARWQHSGNRRGRYYLQSSIVALRPRRPAKRRPGQPSLPKVRTSGYSIQIWALSTCCFSSVNLARAAEVRVQGNLKELVPTGLNHGARHKLCLWMIPRHAISPNPQTGSFFPTKAHRASRRRDCERDRLRPAARVRGELPCSSPAAAPGRPFSPIGSDDVTRLIDPLFCSPRHTCGGPLTIFHVSQSLPPRTSRPLRSSSFRSGI